MKKLLSTAVMLLASFTFCQASPSSSNTALEQRLHTTNPAAPERMVSMKAVDHSVDMFKKNIVTHAGVDMQNSDGFRYPQIGLDYNFSYNDDKRNGGLDSDIHGATLSVGWLTYWDIAMGVMVNGSISDGDAINGVHADSQNLMGTFYASKSFADYFMVGSSFSIGGSDSDTKNVTNEVDEDTTSYTIAPFIGAYYAYKNWFFYTAPTYSYTMQDYETNNQNITNTASSGSLIWANNISYSFNEKLTLTFNATPNWVICDETVPGVVRGDDFWVNFGLSGSYALTDHWMATLGYSYDAFNCDYNNHNANLGLSYAF